ncbi:MAG: hypothetical protein AAB932_03945, partial [Patescibacteria group bacterium]
MQENIFEMTIDSLQEPMVAVSARPSRRRSGPTRFRSSSWRNSSSTAARSASRRRPRTFRGTARPGRPSSARRSTRS